MKKQQPDAPNPRELINRALWLFRPTTEQGKTINDLVLLAERLLAAGYARPDEESAVRREIDDGPRVSVLAWADLLEERGEDGAVCEALRTLARQGKWPGTTGGLYRWSAERPEWGGGASWTLPAAAVAVLARKSQHLGGKEKGRFATASAALLAAARVLAAKPEDDPPARVSVWCHECSIEVEARHVARAFICPWCSAVVGLWDGKEVVEAP